MTGHLLFGMPEDQAGRHRVALSDLREELESHGLRCRSVERLNLPLDSGYFRPILLPPEMDVYGDGHLIATITVVDVPGDGGAWFLLKDPSGQPTEAHSTNTPATAAAAVATLHEAGKPPQSDHPPCRTPGHPPDEPTPGA
ncbi:hypothetical protein [Sphaerisporangium aureirubrum]|uniref:Uncharacterized protein n=1 Tax=Sphaerisporangium aureirubrum TaxID=1544736 RepID=A0ABW1NJZ4_9ACTN